MATKKQIEANRRNALMSPGPRTLAGKGRSRLNAVKHGLTAQQALLPGESEEEFKQFRGAVFGTMSPQGALENQLLERAISLMWRMRRFQAFEVALFWWAAHYQAAQYDADPECVDLEAIARRNDPDPHAPQPNPDLQDTLKVGRMIEALLSEDLTSRLSRYETAMQRQLTGTLKDFREMQKARIELGRTKIESSDADNDEYFEHKGKWLKKIGPP